MSNAADTEAPERRANAALRFIMENFGGFAAVVTVIFTAGVMSAKLETVDRSVASINTTTDRLETSVQQITVDLAVVKARITNIEAEQQRASRK